MVKTRGEKAKRAKREKGKEKHGCPDIFNFLPFPDHLLMLLSRSQAGLGNALISQA
jgi:hypothetical protein